MAFQCEDEVVATQESDQNKLSTYLKAIEDLAASSVCNNASTCKYIALGSKACGGPKRYLVYSTSINVEELERMVAEYNKKETEFNVKWSVSSDCSIPEPPTGVKCENNTCVAIY